MKVKIKRLSENAVIPLYATKGSAGLDLTATSKVFDDHNNVVYGTGLAIQIPEGYVGLLFPRSSVSKSCLMLRNSVGVLDSDYTGEIFFKYHELMTSMDKEYNVGDRVGQLVIVPFIQAQLEEVNELESTERGSGGFGSTGV
jgi:dUTP pyrophosphatase